MFLFSLLAKGTEDKVNLKNSRELRVHEMGDITYLLVVGMDCAEVDVGR